MQPPPCGGYNTGVGGFFRYSDDVERILVRQLGNRLLWIVTGSDLFVLLYLGEVQRASMRWPTENLLALLNFVVEISLVASVASVLVWEKHWAGRHPQVKDSSHPDSSGYALKLHLATVLLLVLAASVFLVLLSYFQYIHLLTVLQRGFLVWLTVIVMPTVFLLANPGVRGGWIGLGAFLLALAAMIGAEWLVVFLSLAYPAFERLGDLYYWNHLVPYVAQRVADRPLWLAIYQPYLGWYFLGYFGGNLMLYLALVLRVLARGRRDATQEGGAQ